MINTNDTRAVVAIYIHVNGHRPDDDLIQMYLWTNLAERNRYSVLGPTSSKTKRLFFALHRQTSGRTAVRPSVIFAAGTAVNGWESMCALVRACGNDRSRPKSFHRCSVDYGSRRSRSARAGGAFATRFYVDRATGLIASQHGR